MVERTIIDTCALVATTDVKPARAEHVIGGDVAETFMTYRLIYCLHLDMTKLFGPCTTVLKIKWNNNMDYMTMINIRIIAIFVTIYINLQVGWVLST